MGAYPFSPTPKNLKKFVHIELLGKRCINDTLVEKINQASSWDETFQIDPLLEACEQTYNEFLNEIIFEDIITMKILLRNAVC